MCGVEYCNWHLIDWDCHPQICIELACIMIIMYLEALKIHHDDIIKWKHFPHYWPFVRGIHRSPVNSPGPVNSPHKGQWRRALMFSLIYAWINGWVNTGEAGHLRRHHAHSDVIVMIMIMIHANPIQITGWPRSDDIYWNSQVLAWHPSHSWYFDQIRNSIKIWSALFKYTFNRSPRNFAQIMKE